MDALHHSSSQALVKIAIVSSMAANFFFDIFIYTSLHFLKDFLASLRFPLFPAEALEESQM